MINGGPYSVLHYVNNSERDILLLTYENELNFDTLASHSVGIAERNYGLGLVEDPANIEGIPVYILAETVNPIAPIDLQLT